MFTTALIFQLGSQQGLGIFRFFVQGGPMGKLVLGVLVLFSLGSWAIILGKLVHFSRANRQSEKFMEAFHRSQRFSEVNAMASKLGASPLVGIFQAGYAEALINPAAGLAAAIPALIAYNYFAQHLRRLRTRMQDFVLEFLNLAERNFT